MFIVKAKVIHSKFFQSVKSVIFFITLSKLLNLLANLNLYLAYRLAMDAKSEQVDQDPIPSLFNVGEPVLADFEGNKKFQVAVICPNFGINEKFYICRFTTLWTIDFTL